MTEVIPHIDIAPAVEAISGHASSAGLIGGLAVAIIQQAAVDKAVQFLKGSKMADPLGLKGLLPGKQEESVAPAPATSAPVVAAASGPSITAAAFGMLPPDAQTKILSMGYHII